MLYLRFDKIYNFIYAFDTESGTYIRTGIITKDGEDSGENAFMASFPHLIDIGIMGDCTYDKGMLCAKTNIQSYHNKLNRNNNNMSIEDFKSLCEQCKNKTNEFALGGAGDPDQHEHFEEILRLCNDYKIIPNITTSGYGITPDIAKICKKYCGTVAVSQYSRLTKATIYKKTNSSTEIPNIEDYSYIGTKDDFFDLLSKGWYICGENEKIALSIKRHVYFENNTYTFKAIEMLLNEGVKTNIHYSVNTDTIDELLIRLKNNAFPKGINSLILLLHKTIGLEAKDKILKCNDERIKELYALIDKQYPFKIGMDSCSVPGVINFNNIRPESLSACEAARFSCYIGPDMVMAPCSFDQDKRYGCNLKEMSIMEAWNSNKFESFRKNNACSNCTNRKYCIGGCILSPEIVLCENKH